MPHLTPFTFFQFKKIEVNSVKQSGNYQNMKVFSIKELSP